MDQTLTIPDTCDYARCDQRPSVAIDGTYGMEYLCRDHFATDCPTLPNPNDECVGFADCPCRKCRDTRLSVTEAHPNHEHISDRSYCGACRTAVLEANRV